MGEWRTIDSAPKCWTKPVILCSQMRNVGEGWYRKPEPHELDRWEEGWVFSADPNVPEPYLNPTHWQPLPAPPEQENG